MKAKDLIKVLQVLDPEKDITFSLGSDQEYRDTCAKAELASGECLEFLAIDKVEFNCNDEEIWCNIVLEQENLICLDDAAKEFDEQYLKR